MYNVPMEAYRPRLRRAALRLVQNESDADDIVQEAFVRWYTSPPREQGCPEAWLVTVVRRLCVDAYRSRRKEQLCDTGALSRWGAPAAGDPAIGLEHEDDIATVLHRLSERATAEECAALLLREGFAYSYGDLARALNKTQEACRQLVHRGKCAAQGVRPIRRHQPVLPQYTAVAFLDALRRCDMAGALSILTKLTSVLQ